MSLPSIIIRRLHMCKTLRFIVFVTLISAEATTALSDPSPPKTITQKNSDCSVNVSGGEYPSYVVLRGKTTLYAPASDGIATALISPSGNYVALSGGDISLLDVEKKKFEYGVVIVSCKTGAVKGYLKGRPTLISAWDKENGLHIKDYLNLTGSEGLTLP